MPDPHNITPPGSRPPFRPTPETTRHIMRTCLATMFLPAGVAWLFFGYHAVLLIVTAIIAALVAEALANGLRRDRQPGSPTHSATIGVIVAFTLPATSPWYLAAIGAAAGVVVGKHIFRGLGNYRWHPALVGRLLLQLFFHDQLSANRGLLLSRAHIFLGNITTIKDSAQWSRFDWFTSQAPPGEVGLLLDRPIAALRNLSSLQFADGTDDLARYLAESLPSLQHCLLGATPGDLGATSAAALALAGLYFIYRGYMHWQLPLCIIASAFIASLLCPIAVGSGAIQQLSSIPVAVQHPAISFTYANYHLFTGSLFLVAGILAVDTTCRPITIMGQMIFGTGIGILVIVLRLYTTIPIPAYAAVLIMNTFVQPIDRLTRSRRRARSPAT